MIALLHICTSFLFTSVMIIIIIMEDYHLLLCLYRSGRGVDDDDVMQCLYELKVPHVKIFNSCN